MTGLIGPKGDQGNAGGTGAQGPKGDIGFTGPMGPMGASPFGLNGLDAFYDMGRVGIGTMTPDAALEVQSDDTDHTSIRIRNTKTSDGIYELRSIQTSGPVNNGFGIWGGLEGFEDYRLIITKDGKVGIGFLDPKTKLSVNGTISAKAFASLSLLIFEAPAGVERMRINDISGEVSVGGVPVIDAGGNWVGPSSAISGTKGDTGAAGAAGPKGDTGTAGTAGPKGDKVGIGTTTPGEQLEITGNFNLPSSTATTGIIKSGGVPFIHNFGPTDAFGPTNFLQG